MAVPRGVPYVCHLQLRLLRVLERHMSSFFVLLRIQPAVEHVSAHVHVGGQRQLDGRCDVGEAGARAATATAAGTAPLGASTAAAFAAAALASAAPPPSSAHDERAY